MAEVLDHDFDPAQLVRDYGDIEGEISACRDTAAVFDFSFLSAARVSGPGALGALARLTDRPLNALAPGRIAYALRSNPQGWLCADLTIWNEGRGHYFVMSGRRQDIRDLNDAGLAAKDDCKIEDISDKISVLAVQGPESLRVFEGIANRKTLARIPYFGFADTRVGDFPCRLGRLGYTGERGFEIILPAANRSALWQTLVARARPCGFAAADCLRIEAGFVLFTNEFRLPVTAAEAGLEAFGRSADAAPRYRLVCLRGKTADRPVIWRPPSPCLPPEPGKVTVTSACHSPLAGGALGFGYVRADESLAGARMNDPTGLFDNPWIVRRPFFDSEKRRPRGTWDEPRPVSDRTETATPPLSPCNQGPSLHGTRT